ncbi:MAG: ankyrin repeat domain-containing protein [Sphingopyxis sp.]
MNTGLSSRLRTILSALFLVAASLAAMPAPAQFGSPGYRFLEAVRDRDGTKTTELLDQTATIINTRDVTTGSTALLIVTERRDPVWIRFLLSRGADANIANREGVTPLLQAAQLAFAEGAQALLAGGARVNASASNGETALHVAVHRRDIAMVRLLIAAGADPDLQDNITGQSPRDYATRDARATAVLAVLNDQPITAPNAPRPAGPN